jgi:hypothetical protein
MSRTLRSALNEANPNKIADGLRALPVGEALGLIPGNIVVNPVAGVVKMPVPCLQAIGAWDRTAGVALTQGPDNVPAGAGGYAQMADGSVTVDPACLQAEILFLAAEGTVVTETLQVVASAATFLSGKHGVIVTAASVTAGLALGPKTTALRGTAPAAGTVALNGAGNGVAFNAADVVNGQATVSYVARPTRSVAEALNGQTEL